MRRPKLGPRRGDVWWVVLDPVRGHEQGGRRPALVVSADGFNASPFHLVVVCPITRTDLGSSMHVFVAPPEGGLRARSFVMCEQVRCISVDRLGSRMGEATARTTAAVLARLQRLVDF